MANKKGKLNPKQLRFCKEYVIDLNGTQAAIRAGYSPNTANEQSAQLLAKLSIKNEVGKLQKKIGDKLDITAEKVLAEFAKIGFSNIQDYINNGYSINEIKSINKDHAAAISSIQVDTYTDRDGNESESVKFKLHDKISALEKIARHIGFFERDNIQKPGVQAPVIQVYNSGPPLADSEDKVE